LLCKAETLFASGKSQEFEDGYESQFSKDLVSFVTKESNEAIVVIEHLVDQQRVNPQVVSEALRWVGRIRDPGTYAARLRLLENCLENSSAAIRDGAILGLANMDDPRSAKSIRNAIQRENFSELREDMEQVLEQLKN
jgi:HEAT repeat protein